MKRLRWNIEQARRLISDTPLSPTPLARDFLLAQRMGECAPGDDGPVIVARYYLPQGREALWVVIAGQASAAKALATGADFISGYLLSESQSKSCCFAGWCNPRAKRQSK